MIKYRTAATNWLREKYVRTYNFEAQKLPVYRGRQLGIVRGLGFGGTFRDRTEILSELSSSQMRARESFSQQGKISSARLSHSSYRNTTGH